MIDNQRAALRYQNKVNNAQGHFFESAIKAACALYSDRERADVDKTPEPFRVLEKSRDGKFKGRFTARAQPDFQGTLDGGRSIVFEAKYTTTDRLKWDVLTQEQGNTSKAFGVHSYDDKSISDVLTARRLDPREVIKKTRFENIDVMPANMTLIRANMEVLMDSTRPQQTRLRSALNAIAEENFYDFCIIDNAPDINISTINALVASDDVIIPIKIDKYAFDGLEELKEQIEDTRDDLNPRLRLAGCLITCFIRADAEKQGEAWLRSRPEYPVFDTRIRYSDKVTESTFSEIPIVEYSRRSGTAMDYIAFVREYLRRGKK